MNSSQAYLLTIVELKIKTQNELKRFHVNTTEFIQISYQIATYDEILRLVMANKKQSFHQTLELFIKKMELLSRDHLDILFDVAKDTALYLYDLCFLQEDKNDICNQ